MHDVFGVNKSFRQQNKRCFFNEVFLFLIKIHLCLLCEAERNAVFEMSISFF